MARSHVVARVGHVTIKSGGDEDVKIDGNRQITVDRDSNRIT